jgi:hypothetical protein
MPTISPFTPQMGSAGSSSLVASTATANIALPVGGGSQIRVCHGGSVLCYVNFGSSTVTASTGIGFPMNANTTEIFTLDTAYAAGTTTNQYTYVALFGSAASVTATVFTRGEGF